MPESHPDSRFIRDLGDGLLLRHATPADADALSEFNSRVHSDEGWDQPEAIVAEWTRDLLTRPHPTFSPGDFTVVEDTRNGQIISSCNLISQTWTYDGIPFGVGRIELVGTHPDYRRRGLIRAQFEALHAWSAARGELVQGITGIPNYYRQFGYEMCLALSGSRSGFEPHVPTLKDDQPEPFQVRPASEADLPFIMGVAAHAARRYLVTENLDEAVWRYELNGRSPGNAHHRILRIIQTPDGEPVGFLAHPGIVWGNRQFATRYELAPGVSWLAVTSSVIRYLWATGQANAAREHTAEKPRECKGFTFMLGAEHPVYRAIPDQLPRAYPPYAWYIRVPDLPGFIRHIAPVLEARLAESVLPGYTGELKLNFYRSGLRLAFENGKLAAAEDWPEADFRKSSADFPDLSFLHLVFGHRSVDELKHIFADCGAREPAAAALAALFPRRASCVWPVA
mgnify:CR=1 FL=1